MADNENKPGKKPNPAIFIGAIVLVLIALGVAQFAAKPGPEEMSDGVTTAAEQAAVEQVEAAPEETDVASQNVSIDVNAALSDRILGDTSAPVKIAEHASFTCGHCGTFHKETFSKIKKEYVDTGKAYILFSDFPLNAPAVHASMVARCLPQDKYFDFVQMLFEKQSEWAYDPNYLDFLKARAGESGLDEAHFQACVQNTDLQTGIVNRMKGSQQQWNINSTPSFVINNRTVVSGVYPFEEFKKMIDDALAGKRADAPGATDQSETAASLDMAPESEDENSLEEPGADTMTEPSAGTAPEDPESNGTEKAE